MVKNHDLNFINTANRYAGDWGGMVFAEDIPVYKIYDDLPNFESSPATCYLCHIMANRWYDGRPMPNMNKVTFYVSTSKGPDSNIEKMPAFHSPYLYILYGGIEVNQFMSFEIYIGVEGKSRIYYIYMLALSTMYHLLSLICLSV